MSAPTDLYRPPSARDALRLPLLGRLLRWRYGRLVFQLPLVVVALLLIYDGFTGTQNAARNLATVAPWVHYRGLAILALLLAGNLFCMGCPFTLPRTLAKRLSQRGRRFPRRLRNKWVAILSLFALFFLYEWLDLWASPALTAWVIVAYFVAAFALEAAFAESPFCKYVCPLGTFNFVYSTASPLQIGVSDPAVCQTCVGKECLNGSYSAEPVILIDQIGTDGQPAASHTHDRRGVLGCGTELFAPQIKSNMDCILCLDCARACPHTNVGLFTRAPGRELLQAGAWQPRWDVSLLVVMLAFLGLLNAFGMIPPVYDLMQTLARALGLTALGWSDETIEALVLALLFIVGGVLMPVALALLAAQFTRLLTKTVKRDSLRSVVAAFAPAFVPLGFGVWAAHYGFHFLIGVWTIIPVLQNFLVDHRVRLLGEPDWTLGGVQNLEAVALIQVILLVGGFLWSMIVAQQIALRRYRRDGLRGFLPWALLFLLMMLIGLWLFDQPMEMRGTILFD